MKNLVSLAGIFLIVLFYCCSPEKKASVPDLVKARLLSQFDSLQEVAEQKLLKSAQNGNAATVRQAFLETRTAYKKIEWFTEYYAPTASRELNGAPLPEIEIEETRVFEPSGLQVIEEYVYPELKETDRITLLGEVNAFLSTFKRTRSILDETIFTEAHILDATKQEVFRTMVLGVSGFDTPLAQTGVQESGVALRAVSQILALFGKNPTLEQHFQQAITFIRQNKDFNAFDRMAYIRKYANPITKEMMVWQKELGIAPLENSLALNTQAATLFDKDAFNVNYFVGNLEARSTPERVALGKDLFFNPVVSGGTRTCASCHRPELAFTDGLPQSATLQAGHFVKRNAPTLLYAGLQHAQFYDMRSPTLENQAMDVIANKDEMHASVEEAVSRLSQDSAYVKAFKKAFPSMEQEIKPRYVMMVLAAYVRSLAPFQSKFDLYMRGEQTRLTKEEIYGFNLFMGKAKCGTCHFMPLFNGTAGPAFSNTEGEVLGVPQNPNATTLVIDPDEGRYSHNKIEELRYAFKTPTLRNIDKTSPYMHNGAYASLEEVLDFYNKGGGVGLGLSLEHQTLPSEPLDLSLSEQKDIIAFLRTLSD